MLGRCHTYSILITETPSSLPVCRMLWGKLKTATAAHLAAQAKLKAKHDLEVADVAAREERVAMQQYQ